MLYGIKNFGGTDSEKFYRTIVLSDGSIIASGSSLSIDGDLTGLNKGISDAIIVRYDNNGNLIWNKNFGGTDYDRFYGMDNTSDGGIILAGYSRSNDIDLPGMNRGSYDGIIVKCDILGDVIWKKSFGGTGTEVFFDIGGTSDDGYLIAGYSSSSNYDMSGLQNGFFDAILIKIDSVGNWVQ